MNFINVYALITLTGMVIGVRILAVEVDKNGMEDNAYVLMINISTEQSVFCALMDKYGINSVRNVCVKLALDGMAISVRNLSIVLAVESITQLLINVFAQLDSFGMVLLAWFNRCVKVGKNGISKYSNVNVLIILIGMAISVCNVFLERHGIN